jgi:Zn-dependent metalloprotease
MSAKRSIFYRILVFLVIISMLALGNRSSATAMDSSAGTKSPQGQDINKCFGDQSQPSYNVMTGKVRFAGSTAASPLLKSAQDLRFASAEDVARRYLSDCGSFFGVNDQAAELTLISQKATNDGRSVARFQQNFKGVPVFGAQLLVQVSSGNDVVLVNGDLLPASKLNIKAGIDAAAAKQTALQFVVAKHQVDASTLKVSAPQLWIYSPALLSEPGAPALVWRMEVTPRELAPIRELVMVDAHLGSVALSINQVDTVLNRKTYTAKNTLKRPGALVCDESKPTCAGGDKDAKNAHIYAGDTYDFYLSHHGRDSIDNAGMTLISTVHFYTNYCNAFWDGKQMTYGDGCFIVTDDVVAHELTHGVTEKESGLIYAFQQGAINESFSDIWGEFVDLTNGSGTDTSAVRWQMGEDTSIRAIRDMQNPPKFGDPDRMGSPLYRIGPGDSGGVHSNSGVGNKAAYLITDGGMFNGYTITGIGITKAAAIYYEAQTNILTPTSNYHSLYDALNAACVTLTGGADGITSADCVQVNTALLATEMNLLPLPPPPPANDSFASPTIIAALPYTDSQDVIAATTAADDPAFPASKCPQVDQGANSVWYQFTAATSNYITINTVGSDSDTVLGVWTGRSPSALTSIGCHDDIDYDGGNYQSRLVIHVTAGQTYVVEVAGWGGVQNLALNVSLAFPAVSISGQDGSILEGGLLLDSTSPTFRLGDDAANKQYRDILSFDTKGLPDGAVITNVTLQLRMSDFSAYNVIKALGGFMVDIKKGAFGLAALQSTDFQASTSHTYGPFKPALSDWYNIKLPGTYINTQGYTQIRLRFNKDSNNNNAADYIILFSGDAGNKAYRPRLLVEYFVP